jgi:plastocyanin
MRSLATHLAAIAIATTPVLGEAAEHVVSQQGKAFTPEVVEAKVGDTLAFHNDDKVGHTIYSETPGFEFEIGKQQPGEDDVITLDEAGEFEVRCAIHPRMRLKVVVSE